MITLTEYINRNYGNGVKDLEIVTLTMDAKLLHRKIFNRESIRVTCAAISADVLLSDVLALKPDAQVDENNEILTDSSVEEKFRIFKELALKNKILDLAEINPYPKEIVIHAYGENMKEAIDSLPSRDENPYLDCVEGSVYVQVFSEDMQEDEKLEAFAESLISQENIKGSYAYIKRPEGYPENCLFDLIINPYDLIEES